LFAFYRTILFNRYKNKRLRSFFYIKLIASTVLFAFTLQQCVYAAPEVIKPLHLNLFQKPLVDFKIPESIATIEDSWHPSLRGARQAFVAGDVAIPQQKDHSTKKTIYLIQDAHTNESGQINISKTLDHILKQEPSITHIFLEAGYGDESLGFLRDLVPLDERKRVGMSFLRKGKLQGSEYFNLTKNHNITLYGVEDLNLYKEAWDSYKHITKQRAKFKTYLTKIKTTIKTLKPKIYNPQLLQLDQKHQSFLKEEMPLTEWIEVILRSRLPRRQAGAAGDEESPRKSSYKLFPHIQQLTSLKTLESSINFEQANNELLSLRGARQELLAGDVAISQNKTVSKLSSKDPKEQLGYFLSIEDKVLTPELMKYIQYLKTFSKLNPKKILEEQASLELRTFNQLARTEDENNLITVSRNLRLLDKLFNLQITPEEYQAYLKNKKTHNITFITGFLNKKIMDQRKYYERALFLEEGYEDLIKEIEHFYNLTYLRDKAFLENMFKVMTQDKAILITGGYHTPNLKSLLKNQNISFISITPQVTHETNHQRYERILLSQNIDTFYTTDTKIASSSPMETQSTLMAARMSSIRDLRNAFNLNGNKLGARLPKKRKKKISQASEKEELEPKNKVLPEKTTVMAGKKLQRTIDDFLFAAYLIEKYPDRNPQELGPKINGHISYRKSNKRLQHPLKRASFDKERPSIALREMSGEQKKFYDELTKSSGNPHRYTLKTPAAAPIGQTHPYR